MAVTFYCSLTGRLSFQPLVLVLWNSLLYSHQQPCLCRVVCPKHKSIQLIIKCDKGSCQIFSVKRQELPRTWNWNIKKLPTVIAFRSTLQWATHSADRGGSPALCPSVMHVTVMQKFTEVRLHSVDASCIGERRSSLALSVASGSRTERAGVEPASLWSFLSYPERRREQTLTAHRWLCLHTETLHKIQLHDCNTSHGLFVRVFFLPSCSLLLNYSAVPWCHPIKICIFL